MRLASSWVRFTSNAWVSHTTVLSETMSDLSQHAVVQNIPSTGYSSQQLFDKTILLWLLLLQLSIPGLINWHGLSNYATYSAINVCTMITPSLLKAKAQPQDLYSVRTDLRVVPMWTGQIIMVWHRSFVRSKCLNGRSSTMFVLTYWQPYHNTIVSFHSVQYFLWLYITYNHTSMLHKYHDCTG